MIDKVKLFPLKTTLTKDDYKYKECRLDYLVLECKNLEKKKEFVYAVKQLETDEVDVLSMDAFLKEKRQQIDKYGKVD